MITSYGPGTVAYEFSMPDFIYVQLEQQPSPCKIEAIKIEEQGQQDGPDGRLIVKNSKDEVVGKFKSISVAGWWRQHQD